MNIVSGYDTEDVTLKYITFGSNTTMCFEVLVGSNCISFLLLFAIQIVNDYPHVDHSYD